MCRWRKATTASEKIDVFWVGAAAEALQNTLLRLGRPEDPKILTCSSYSCVEDVVCDVVFIGIGDYDLNGVVLETLRLVNRHGVGHLEWHGGVQ